MCKSTKKDASFLSPLQSVPVLENVMKFGCLNPLQERGRKEGIWVDISCIPDAPVMNHYHCVKYALSLPIDRVMESKLHKTTLVLCLCKFTREWIKATNVVKKKKYKK